MVMRAGLLAALACGTATLHGVATVPTTDSSACRPGVLKEHLMLRGGALEETKFQYGKMVKTYKRRAADKQKEGPAGGKEMDSEELKEWMDEHDAFDGQDQAEVYAEKRMVKTPRTLTPETLIPKP